MRKIIVAAAFVALSIATSGSAQAQCYYGDCVRYSSATALAGGAAGAAIGGPYGFAIGTVVGAAIGVPRFTQRNQECWYDRAGMRHCRFY
jgi:hypothetical protein